MTNNIKFCTIKLRVDDFYRVDHAPTLAKFSDLNADARSVCGS